MLWATTSTAATSVLWRATAHTRSVCSHHLTLVPIVHPLFTVCSKVQNCIDPCQKDTENNVCRIQCGDGTYRSGDHCYHCGDTNGFCQQCDQVNAGKCSECIAGYVLDNGECFEADQYVLDKIASSLGPSCTATLGQTPSDCPAGFTHHVDGDGITALFDSFNFAPLPCFFLWCTCFL